MRETELSSELLHAQFAGGLRGLIEQRQHESEIDRLERELNDPNRFILAYMLKSERDMGTYFAPNDTTTYIRIHSETQNIFGLDETLDELMEDIFEESNLEDRIDFSDGADSEVTFRNSNIRAEQFVIYNLLGGTKKRIQDKEYLAKQILGLYLTTLIATDHLPENYDEATKPRKHKHESFDELLFRKAISILIDASREPNSREYKAYRRLKDRLERRGGEFTKNILEELQKPENEDLRQGRNDLRIALLAHDLVSGLIRPDFTPDAVREMFLKYKRLQELRKVEPEIDVEETTWTILPAGAMEEVEKTGKSGSEYTPGYVDPERLKWLARLALAWGPGAYIAVADLSKTGETQYYAAILPQTTPDGIEVEHAVAENASSGNATYVFRAERGLENDGSIWLHWKNVLKDDKRGARMLGARKVMHNENWDENVQEYLTRSPEHLDKSGYKR